MRRRLEDRSSLRSRLFSVLCLVVVVLYFVGRAFFATGSYENNERETTTYANKQAEFHLGLHLGLFKNVKNIDVPPVFPLQDVPVLGSHTQSLDGAWEAFYVDSQQLRDELEVERQEKDALADKGEYDAALVRKLANLTLTGHVPGDVITDLYKAKQIDDPLFNLNYKDHEKWDKHTWYYEKNFVTDYQFADAGSNSSIVPEVYLVFDGIKMGARLRINGHLLGIANNQFRRFQFPISSFLNTAPDKPNRISVEFPPQSRGIDCEGRFMACSGGWDWAPYSDTVTVTEHQGQRYATFSKGIWKSVYLTYSEGVIINHVVYQTFAADPLWNAVQDSHEEEAERVRSGPSKMAAFNKTGNFDVEVTLHLNSLFPNAIHGVVFVDAEWLKNDAKVNFTVELLPGISKHTVLVKAEKVELWWPRGVGPQRLYTISVAFLPLAAEFKSRAIMTHTRKLGFRTAYLNNYLPGQADTVLKQLMVFQINEVSLFARGSNLIPMEVLEGRYTEQGYKTLVKNAVDANFNIIRVWGGGIFLHRLFYEECDRLGLMVYHDMMFGDGNVPVAGHFPKVDSPNQIEEIRHQIRRLSVHPSIVLWSSCNECGHLGNFREKYIDFVMNHVVQEDKSRVVWPASPSAGWSSGVNPKTNLPNGRSLDALATYAAAVESHAPYIRGNGHWGSVNFGGKGYSAQFNLQMGTENLIPTRFPSQLANVSIGFDAPGSFVSEFGVTGFSSFESMSGSLSKNNWNIVGDVMSHRNFGCDGFIKVYFNVTDVNTTGLHSFKKHLYLCMLGQAFTMKNVIETKMATNVDGLMTWQYNEIWPTGGWGSIEYGADQPGQVVGGRWKPLHYLFRDTLYADIFFTCGLDDQKKVVCFVRNNSPFDFDGIVTLRVVTWLTSHVSSNAKSQPESEGSEQAVDEDESASHLRRADGEEHANKDAKVAADGEQHGASPVHQAPIAATLRVRLAPSKAQVLSLAGQTEILDLFQATRSSKLNVSFIAAEVQSKDHKHVLARNTILLTEPKNFVNLPNANVTLKVTDDWLVHVRSDAVALFVALTTTTQGNFAENYFYLEKDEVKEVPFIPHVRDSKTLDHLTNHIRVEHLGQYLAPSRPHSRDLRDK